MAQAANRWSGEVTAQSDAMDLKEKLFTSNDPHEIALSLKHAAEASQRRKASPFPSAMSMLTFYINRAGRNLSTRRRKKLDAAKGELRSLFARKSVSRKS